MTVKVDIAIMTCSARWGYAEAIAKKIGGDVTIIYDNGGYVWGTAKRCWEALAEMDGSHALLLQEDILICQDFRATVEHCAELQPGKALGFYANRRPVDEARERGDSWVVIPDGVWGQATCFPTEWVSPMLEWVATSDHYSTHYRRRVCDFPPDRWDDRKTTAWLEYMGRPVYCTVPSLVQHRKPSTSLVGNSNRNRVARWFIGEDVSGLSVDWSKGLGHEHHGQ